MYLLLLVFCPSSNGRGVRLKRAGCLLVSISDFFFHFSLACLVWFWAFGDTPSFVIAIMSLIDYDFTKELDRV